MPAKRIPSQTGLPLTRKVSLSLDAPSRKRQTVRVGLSESPAFVAALAGIFKRSGWPWNVRVAQCLDRPALGAVYRATIVSGCAPI